MSVMSGTEANYKAWAKQAAPFSVTDVEVHATRPGRVRLVVTLRAGTYEHASYAASIRQFVQRRAPLNVLVDVECRLAAQR